MFEQPAAAASSVASSAPSSAPSSTNSAAPVTSPGSGPAENLEVLEAEICQLAGHLAAATCQFLVLLGEFDAREGWASWDMSSCAAWLSWKCQLASGTAREHVRVARALRALPVIRGEFAAGRLSYAKARALTRIAAPDTEADLVEIATPMTANQLERFARAHRTVTRADDEQARLRRRLTFRTEDDGSLTLSAHLPPEDGAALLIALRAVLSDAPATSDDTAPQSTASDGPASATQPTAVPAETPPATQPPPATQLPPATQPPTTQPLQMRPTSASLADALVEIAEAYLASQSRAASNPDVYQVIVHATPEALVPDTAQLTPEQRKAAAKPLPSVTPAASRPSAAPMAPGERRCHVEDGPAVSKAALQQLACDAVLRWMTHDRDGHALNVGRRRREPTPAQRVAVRERDNCRCRFPGCPRRATQVHHIWWWMHGGPTDLDNLISLCRYHHGLIHRNGYQVRTSAPGVFTFHRPDGDQIPDSPPLPQPNGQLWDVYDAEITPETIVPPWYGERLDLDHAIWVLFANQQVRKTREQATALAA